jgi:hypothetical protein
MLTLLLKGLIAVRQNNSKHFSLCVEFLALADSGLHDVRLRRTS